MRFSEADDPFAGQLPPFPEELEIPEDWDEALVMFAVAAKSDLARERRKIGHSWDRLTESLTAIDDVFGTDGPEKISYHTTGGRIGTQVLIRTIGVQLEPEHASGLFSRRQDVSVDAWNVIVNTREQDDRTETVHYREFTILKDVDTVRATRQEASAQKPLDEVWTFQELGACVLLSSVDETCWVSRGVKNRQLLPKFSTLVPGNITAARNIREPIDEVFEIAASLSAGTHEEAITTLKLMHG